jgi:DNA-directed RNA polymerase beta' subunit
MANKGISLSEIERKEAELEQVIQEYYRYDMASLKAEINNILSVETEKLERDRRAKAQEIEDKFN